MGQNPAKPEPINVLSPKGVNVGQPGVSIFKYSGNVKLRHRGVLLFCDQALHQVNVNRIEAIGHVLIVQGDTIIIKADTMVYEGTTRQATLRGRVTFQDRRIILNAALLDYNLATGIAHYATKGRLVDSRNVLTSREGYYDIRSRQIELQHTVRLVSPENTLTADGLLYNTANRVATLVESTRITGKDGVSVARQGQYDTQEGVFQQNETGGTLKYARTNDSLNYALTTQSILAKGSLALLTAIDKPVVASQTPTTIPAKSSLRGKIALSKTSARPIENLTLAASNNTKPTLNKPLARHDTTYMIPGSVVENLKITKEDKAIARGPVGARTPIKREEPVSASATLVPAIKPDEQVTLATPSIGQPMSEKLMVQIPTDSVATPAKPLAMPVRLTGAVFLKPVKTTAIKLQLIPVIGQKVSPLPPVQYDSTHLAALATVLPNPAINATVTSTTENSLPTVSPSVKPAVPAKSNATTGLTRNSTTPIIATTVATPAAALPEALVRQVANPQAGSGLRAAIVVPPKRVAPVRQASPDPEESDLERTLNRKKRFN